MTDEQYMTRAIELAWRGRFTTMPNPNVGCVIVNKGKIVGEGWHHYRGLPHAEINALRMAGDQAKGSTVYVTLEPCSHYGHMAPCCNALIDAGVTRVVAAIQDPNPQVAGGGLYRLQQAGIEVKHGICIDAAERLNRGFLKRMRTGFPFIQLKLAASIDGRTAMANGESQWITSCAARRDVQILRAQSSAILTSAITVLADDPLLTVRWQELDHTVCQYLDKHHLRQPVRMIIDTQGRITSKNRLIKQPGETWLIRTKTYRQDWPKNVIEMVLPKCNRTVDLITLMLMLGQCEINSVLVEAGASLSGALLSAELIDELIVYLAPKLLGSDARSLCVLPGLEHLSDVRSLSFNNVCMIGKDLRVTLNVR
ncbi:bifunctional diaminohydroxyphosphoribosylaminopyrimidine deaminase/5-amino-6-(5-phosphoribosylamino)uracil reductase RibD [Candidatus Pantoea carbekii]|uniref:Riboflavin biosynthesis protein RibD n=1 Tax=Candidatus Pantoea carbekii TaxID=1235990 RepID=U3U3M6_9GAMM|nr:bifunctional diaminohydroxyphosphoribosylaminopyrimidine deaminase/5-amino-6-(5-phosphoribosylamino)uracil reductase RibD [Candidatus Pantoea carbekii]AKC32240.1 riboflavin biosynthesis protein ribD [Candidatus Pantoea carbekii]BAO00776.1 RibD protein [Candidatus Pantoea carbekii]